MMVVVQHGRYLLFSFDVNDGCRRTRPGRVLISKKILRVISV